MTAAIKNLLEGCQACQTLQASQPVEPMIEQETPSPMSTVGADLFDVHGKTWLVLVDKYSGFPFATELRSLATSAVCKVLRPGFATGVSRPE